MTAHFPDLICCPIWFPQKWVQPRFFLVGIVLMALQFSVLCFVDRCLSSYPFFFWSFCCVLQFTVSDYTFIIFKLSLLQNPSVFQKCWCCDTMCVLYFNPISVLFKQAVVVSTKETHWCVVPIIILYYYYMCYIITDILTIFTIL